MWCHSQAFSSVKRKENLSELLEWKFSFNLSRASAWNSGVQCLASYLSNLNIFIIFRAWLSAVHQHCPSWQSILVSAVMQMYPEPWALQLKWSNAAPAHLHCPWDRSETEIPSPVSAASPALQLCWADCSLQLITFFLGSCPECSRGKRGAACR